VLPRGGARVLVAITVIVTVMGMVGVTPATASPPSMADYLRDQERNHQAALFAQDVQASLESQADFGGLRITSDGVEISTVGSPADSVRSAVAEAAKNRHADQMGAVGGVVQEVPVIYREVKHSMAELNSLTSRIDSEQMGLSQQGLTLASWGPDVVDNVVVVHLRQYSQDVAKQLEARYGDAVRVATESQDVVESASRTADSTPWFGADKIVAIKVCTSWFSATKSGSPVAVTSGHCGTGAVTHNGAAFGTVSLSQYGGSMDGEIIPVASNGGYVWADPGAANRAVKSVASSDTVGSGLCTDGATDREVCGITVMSVNQTVTYDNHTITGLVYAVKEDLITNAFSPGDSGGPVYMVTSTGVTAYGMIEATVVNSNYYGWYMPARTVQSYFGITIKTV